MRFFRDLGRGFSSYGDAISFLFKKGLWFYFLYPLLIALGLFLAGMASMFAVREWLTDLIMEKAGLNGDSFLTAFAGSWIRDALHWVIGAIIGVLSFMLFNALYKYIVLIILSPVMAYLSERVEEEKTGKKYPFNFGHFVKDILRGILITFRNMFLEMSIVVLCLFIAWIPVIGWLVAIFLYVLSSYFLGFSMMDYTCERRRLKIRQGVRLIRRHKGIAIGNGMTFSLLLLIPFVGISIGPILAVTAATLATMEAMDRDAFEAQQQSQQAAAIRSRQLWEQQQRQLWEQQQRQQWEQQQNSGSRQ